METQTQRLMPAKAVKTANNYRYEYADGFTVVVERDEDYPDQLNVRVRSPQGNTISEMLVWAREAKKE